MQKELSTNHQKTTNDQKTSKPTPTQSNNHGSKNISSKPLSLIPAQKSNHPKSPLALSPTVNNAWRQRSPNVSFSCDQPSLSEVMSEQLKLKDLEYEIVEKIPDIDLNETLPENVELETSSDALLAKMLQNEYNKEYNQELDFQEAKLNSGHKVITSLKRYRLSVSESTDDSLISSHEDQDILEQLEEAEYFEDVGKKLDFTLQGRNAAWDPDRREFVSKHDTETCYKKNAQKMESFPINFNTGDTIGVSLNNNIYNNLKSHAYKEKRSQKRSDKVSQTGKYHRNESEESKSSEKTDELDEFIENSDDTTKLQNVQNTIDRDVRVDKESRTMLFKLVKSGVLESVNGVISIGKESVILHAKGGKNTPQNQMNSLKKSIPENIAIKVFKTTMSEFRHRDKYIQDDFRFQDRFKKLNSKKLAYLWAEKECRNLERLENARISCPEVVLLKRNLLFLRFIGKVSDTGGNSSSSALKLSELKNIEEHMKIRMWEQTLEIMKKMWSEAKLVHADLSEYNLLWHENKVYVIDVAQSVEPTHPKALEFLYRDCERITKFFGGKLQIKTVPNPRKLFLEISKIDLGLSISEWTYFDETSGECNVSSEESADFITKIEEMQRRAKEHADGKRDLVNLDDERIIEIKDD